MGGCRCCFRNCPVNSANSPGRSFFHFPVKNEEERLNKWIKYANVEQLRVLTPQQMRNKVVCNSHFRDECYMNYMRNKLTRTAVPTLMPVRMNSEYVFDYEASDNPQPIKLPKPTAKHLIPPEDLKKTSSLDPDICEELEDPILNKIYSDEVILTNNEEEFTLITLEDEDIPSKSVPKRDLKDADYVPQLKKVKTNKIPASPKILNRAVNRSSGTSRASDVSSKAPKTFQQSQANQKLSKITTDNKKTSDKRVTIVSNETANIKLYTEKEISNFKKEKNEEYEKRIKELEEKLKAKQEEINKVVTQVQTVSTSKEPSIVHSQKQLTKAQLFNSIKKYLSSSMSALVRMEMFGSPEREWKSDEKQASMELLKLGDKVFNYFRDEWRFRLPARKEVERWISDNDEIYDEENL